LNYKLNNGFIFVLNTNFMKYSSRIILLFLILLITLNGCVGMNRKVSKINDQQTLIRIALEDEDSFRREIAVYRLNDPKIIARVALEDKRWEVRKAAVTHKKLTDQKLLAELAVKSKEWGVQSEAIKKINDQKLLTQIVLEDENELVRSAAIEKVTDQTLLYRIALESENKLDRFVAVRRLTNQNFLEHIALNHVDLELRYSAVGKLTNHKLLSRLSNSFFNISNKPISSELFSETMKTVATLKLALLDPTLMPVTAKYRLEASSDKLTEKYNKVGSSDSVFLTGETITISIWEEDTKIQTYYFSSNFRRREFLLHIKANIDLQSLFEKFINHPKLDKIDWDKVALDATTWELRFAAVSKVNDPKVLKQIELKNEDTSLFSSQQIRKAVKDRFMELEQVKIKQ